jgi:hypothetical protein
MFECMFAESTRNFQEPWLPDSLLPYYFFYVFSYNSNAAFFCHDFFAARRLSGSLLAESLVPYYFKSLGFHIAF